MIIEVKKNILYIDEFKLKCCVGKAGIKQNKIEGDKSTPKGTFKIKDVYYRKDRLKKLETNLSKKQIKKKLGWCDDPSSRRYNKLIFINKNTKISYEKMYRNDFKYDIVIPILYNYFKPKKNKGSAIFIHLTKDYKPTLGCIGLKKKDLLISKPDASQERATDFTESLTSSLFVFLIIA